MANPISVSDGDFSLAVQNGSWEFDFPFADKGDTESYIAKRRMRQQATSFVQPTAMEQRSFSQFTNGTAYLCDVKDAADVGNGLLEWKETWACVPKTRLEFAGTTYTQIIGFDGDTPLQFTGNFDSLTVHEYDVLPEQLQTWPRFITTPSAGNIIFPPNTLLPTLLAPRIVDLGGGNFKRIEWSTADIYVQGAPILAEDTTSEIYMGRILYRKSIYVNRKTLSTL